MSRLHKKCVLGATTLHALLLLALLVGPGFFNRPAQNDAPLLEIIPDVATDAEFKGGGAPRVAERLPEQPTQAVQPVQPAAPPPPQAGHPSGKLVIWGDLSLFIKPGDPDNCILTNRFKKGRGSAIGFRP